MRISTILLALIPPLVAIVAVWWWQAGDEPDTTGQPSEPADMVWLNQQTPEPPKPSPDDVQSSASQPAPPVSAGVIGDRARYQKYENIFANELVDPVWSPAMEAEIGQLLKEVPIPYLKLDVACRTTVCRAVITHDFGVEALAATDGQNPVLDFSMFSKALASLPQRHYPRIQTIRVSTWPSGPGALEGPLETRVYITAADSGR